MKEYEAQGFQRVNAIASRTLPPIGRRPEPLEIHVMATELPLYNFSYLQLNAVPRNEATISLSSSLELLGTDGVIHPVNIAYIHPFMGWVLFLCTIFKHPTLSKDCVSSMLSDGPVRSFHMNCPMPEETPYYVYLGVPLLCTELPPIVHREVKTFFPGAWDNQAPFRALYLPSDNEIEIRKARNEDPRVLTALKKLGVHPAQ